MQGYGHRGDHGAGACLGSGFYKTDAGRAEAAGSGRKESRQWRICKR